MNDDPKIYPDPVPDREGAVVRGVCGLVLGFVVAASIWMRVGGLGLWASVSLFLVVVVGCAWGSVRYGDAFWYDVLGRRP